MAFQTPMTIKEAVDRIHNNRYLLPAIQPGFTDELRVWWVLNAGKCLSDLGQ